MSKETDERSTPLELFNSLNDEFRFELDVCATHENKKVDKYFTKEDKSLIQSWAPLRCFMNPPYSNIPRWLGKAKDESDKGALVVCVLPMDSSTQWFHDFIYNKEIRNWRERVSVIFPSKRYKFGEYDTGAKFATLIAIFHPLVK